MKARLPASLQEGTAKKDHILKSYKLRLFYVIYFSFHYLHLLEFSCT